MQGNKINTEKIENKSSLIIKKIAKVELVHSESGFPPFSLL